MALTEQVILDITQAQRQINDLERQLQTLSTPIDVPVDIGSTGEIERLRQDLGQADNSVEALNRELNQTDDALRRVGREADDSADAMLRVGTRGVSAFTNLRGSILGVAAGFAAFQGARAFLDFAGESIEAASDLEESTSKAQVVFGEFFDDIQAFSQTAPQALGLANAEALEFAGTFGNLFVALGLSQQAAAELSPEIVQLGSDLASFNNIEVTDALEKLRAGLVGEAEPLRALGVNLTAATVEAKALELGFGGLTGEISEAEKVQARYALILEQTATAQGDFARTSEGIANRQRTLNAEFENFRAEVGEALLPAMEALLTIAPQVISGLQGLIPVIADLAAGLASAASDTDGFINIFGDIPNVIGGVADVASGATTGLFNLSQAFIDLLTFDVVGFFDRGRAALEGFADLDVSLQLRSIREDILDLLRAGADPVAVFGAGVAEIGQATDDVAIFRQEVERLFAVTGVGASAVEVFRLLSANADELGLSSSEIALLIPILREVLGITEALPPPLDEVVNGLSQAGDAAAAAAPQVGLLAGAAAEIEGALTGIDLADFNARIAEIEAGFDRLPSGLDAAREALRNDENEIVSDFSDFLTNLEDELAQQQAFNQNIEILRRLGLDQLADAFTTEGLSASAALADAVSNPQEAARAEALLDEQAEAQAASYRQAFIRALEAEDFTVNARVNLIITELDIDRTPGPQTDIIGGRPTPGNVGNQQGVTVQQNFFTEPTPTTETERAAQQINALVNVD